jgi:hypothetical protein
MTSTDKMTLDTAFHTLLEKTEELGMCEGDYLKMTNLLKKTYEESKKPAPQTIQPIRVELCDCFSFQKVVVEITRTEKETVSGEYKDRMYVCGTTTYHESADTVQTTEFRKYLTRHAGAPKSNSFGPYLSLLSNRFEPSRYEFEIDGFRQTFSYKDAEDKIHSDRTMECQDYEDECVDLDDFRMTCMNAVMDSIGNFVE